MLAMDSSGERFGRTFGAFCGQMDFFTIFEGREERGEKRRGRGERRWERKRGEERRGEGRGRGERREEEEFDEVYL